MVCKITNTKYTKQSDKELKTLLNDKMFVSLRDFFNVIQQSVKFFITLFCVLGCCFTDHFRRLYIKTSKMCLMCH